MSNLAGILLMITAMAGFALEDMFVKQLSGTISAGQILIVLGIGGGVIFAGLTGLGRHEILVAQNWTRPIVVRMVAEAVAACAFVISLSLVPLSTVAAIFQATPLAITMGAALFLGEEVGWRRWSAILVGFLGVLIIIRPGFSGFDASALLVVISVIGASARDLITRRIPKTVSSTLIAAQAFAAVVPAGILLMVLKSEPLVAVSETESFYFAGAIVFGVVGYYGLVAAMRAGDTAIVIPFRYTRLLFSITIGVVVFSEKPDALTLFGAAIVLATGLYTLYRERKRLLRKSTA